MAMDTRRQFIRFALRCCAWAGAAVHLPSPWLREAAAAPRRRILPKGTDLQQLRSEHPATLDTRHLEIMPVDEFKTMGATDHEVQLDRWRLVVAGRVGTPLSLAYSELTALPAVEEEVLLICPGIFTIHARWKGVAVSELLKLAGAAGGSTHVTVHGPEGPYEKVENFALTEVGSGKVLLAYEVNGQALPRRHGYPLRVVAADRFGSDWVKFVYKVEVR
jgi:sulfoxide reductase catalytic subunit YedY